MYVSRRPNKMKLPADPSSAAPRYFFVSDQNHVFTTALELTARDIESVMAGLYQIIRVADLAHLDRSGQWQSTPAGVLTESGIEAGEPGLFHVHPSYVE